MQFPNAIKSTANNYFLRNILEHWWRLPSGELTFFTSAALNLPASKLTQKKTAHKWVLL
jgi:hypothetical protein